MVIALHHSRATGAAKLVLLGIANHDGDGGAWPSVAKLAKYAGVSSRMVQKSIKQLEELHEVSRDLQRGGNAYTPDTRRPNLYKFLLQCPPNCDRTKEHRTTKTHVVLELSTGVNSSSPGEPQFAGGVNSSSPEPSFNPPTTTEKRTYVPGRARGACGHGLVDDRHCDRGCSASRVEGAA